MEISNQDKLKLIHFLNFICDYEASKPIEEMDEELIKSCVKVSLKLQNKQVNHSPEFIDEKVRKIFRKEETEITEPEAVKPVKKQINKKKVWLVAACIAILVALFSIVSVANDWDVFDFLSEKFGSVHSAPVEEELDFNGVTVVNRGKGVTYETLEEALQKENIDVLYPAFLPEGTKVQQLLFSQNNGSTELSYIFDNQNLSSNIYFNTQLSQAFKDVATEIITLDSITYYICEKSDTSSVQVEFEYKGNTYMFYHTDKNVLIEIIENLEEINNEN